MSLKRGEYNKIRYEGNAKPFMIYITEDEKELYKKYAGDMKLSQWIKGALGTHIGMIEHPPNVNDDEGIKAASRIIEALHGEIDKLNARIHELESQIPKPQDDTNPVLKLLKSGQELTIFQLIMSTQTDETTVMSHIEKVIDRLEFNRDTQTWRLRR